MSDTAVTPSPQSVSELIDALGASWLARFFGHKNPSTVSGWKSRGTIPPEYWVKIVAAASEKDIPGVSADSMARWHAESRNLLPEAAVPATQAEAVAQ